VPSLLLVINPGNTSTKVGIFAEDRPRFVETIKHTDDELRRFRDINSQLEFRKEVVLGFLKTKNVPLASLAAIVARGGLLKPVPSGTFIVSERMIADLVAEKKGAHASNLAAQIGYAIAQTVGITCYVVDPVSVDECQSLARYSGHRLFERVMLTHALNMRAVAKRHAKENRLDYSRLTLIVIHLGTGVSLSLHCRGRMIDAVNPSEEGPFSMDRSGGLPILQIARYICDNRMPYKDFEKTVFGSGGVYSYLGVKDFLKVQEMIGSGHPQAQEIVDAMAYQIAKDAGALSTVVAGDVDGILITGGMAHVDSFVNQIRQRIAFIAPVRVYPGEDEMQALAEGAWRVLSQEEKAKEY